MQLPAAFKINYTDLFIDTQVTSVIEAIHDWKLPNYFRLYLGGGSSGSLKFQNI